MMWSQCALLLVMVMLAASHAEAQLDRLLRLPTTGASDAKIGDGLKEALQIGTEKAVSVTGQTDGYFANALIKIVMPDSLRTVERGLRVVGQGERVDEFILSMNRAAERAAPAAKSIFWDAITAMTIDDGRRILQGSNTAATDYFKRTTTEKLTTAFGPVVSSAMDEVGVTRQYKELVGAAQALPFVNVQSLDLDRYVVGKALEGLFVVVGQEEQQIRTNPAARITPLLKEVFTR